MGFHLGTLRVAEREHVDDQPAARSGREDVGPPGQVLLDDVVLRGAPQRGAVHAVIRGVGDVEAEQPCRGGVDRHRRVHLALRDAVEQRAHVTEMCDGHADLAHLAPGQGMVRVVARSGWGGRRRSTGPSDPWPGWSGRARWTPWRWNDPSRCASATAGPSGSGQRKRHLGKNSRKPWHILGAGPGRCHVPQGVERRARSAAGCGPDREAGENHDDRAVRLGRWVTAAGRSEGHKAPAPGKRWWRCVWREIACPPLHCPGCVAGGGDIHRRV